MQAAKKIGQYQDLHLLRCHSATPSVSLEPEDDKSDSEKDVPISNLILSGTNKFDNRIKINIIKMKVNLTINISYNSSFK